MLDRTPPVCYFYIMQSHGEFFADKLMDLANLAMAALVFGQLVNKEIQWGVFTVGVACFWICIVLSFFFRRQTER